LSELVSKPDLLDNLSSHAQACFRFSHELKLIKFELSLEKQHILYIYIHFISKWNFRA